MTSNASRSAGILLHPTSLPGPYGIGDLGSSAFAWVDTLARTRQTWWQLLPLTPTGFGDSPYSSFSAFAGNPLLISPDSLADDGLVRRDDLGGVHLPEERVDYGAVFEFKTALLSRAWENFRGGAAAGLRGPLEDFCTWQAWWLDDYALFMALKESRGGEGWQQWPADLKQRKPHALQAARRELADAVGRHQFRQFLFFRQLRALRTFARERGVRLIGDIPIFVAADSADVWSHPELFLLDKDLNPKVVSGVPPDYFAKTGQLWGNPHYDWQAMKRDDYAWWVARFRATLGQVDLIRLDHFLGFDKAWHVRFGSPTAEKGEFVPGPGADFFASVRRQLGLPFIAEDLGLVTPEVEKLRDDFHMPGMLILQFAFGGATENRFLPHNYERNAVVYTGTHDNDTTRGWYAVINDVERDHLRRYTGRDGSDVSWDLIRLAWSSVANYALTTLQDVLDLGTEARMNFPGKESGNWSWRFRWEQLTESVVVRLRDTTALYGRDAPRFEG